MLEAGQVLRDRYQLKHKLGHNAGRQTWLAEDITTQPAEPVILKLLAFGDSVHWEDLKLFEREADVLKQLNHPQIPIYRDYFSIDDRILWFGLVYEYIPGYSLKQLLAQGRKFSEKEVRKFATNVLHILTYLHELSPAVLHRDIKPSNLILGEDKQIYLVDFGAVQDRAASEGATFTVVGTYGYAPMEQFGGRAVPASDLYALGATLIHLLTGTAPADLPQKNMRICFKDRVSLSRHFIDWIERLTNPDVEQRFSKAREAMQALESKKIERSVSTSVAKFERPHNTRVKLFKSDAKLEIIIPKNTLYSSRNSSYSYALDYKHGWNAWLTSLIKVVLGLIVIIPASFSIVFGYIFLLVILAQISPILAVILIFLPLFLMLISSKLTYTRIYFNKNNFVIKNKVFSLTTSEFTGLTKQIRAIQLGGLRFRNQHNRCIVIKSISDLRWREWREDVFGQELTDDEREWLIQEIKDWLDLSPL